MMKIPNNEFMPEQPAVTGDPVILQNMNNASKGQHVSAKVGLVFSLIIFGITIGLIIYAAVTL